MSDQAKDALHEDVLSAVDALVIAARRAAEVSVDGSNALAYTQAAAVLASIEPWAAGL